jgi:hypothetical protein
MGAIFFWIGDNKSDRGLLDFFDKVRDVGWPLRIPRSEKTVVEYSARIIKPGYRAA